VGVPSSGDEKETSTLLGLLEIANSNCRTLYLYSVSEMCPRYLGFQTMGKVEKLQYSVHYTPPSEPFRKYYLLSLYYYYKIRAIKVSTINLSSKPYSRLFPFLTAHFQHNRNQKVWITYNLCPTWRKTITLHIPAIAIPYFLISQSCSIWSVTWVTAES
jgi:hypothetical protein